jgi:hypothetical protein
VAARAEDKGEQAEATEGEKKAGLAGLTERLHQAAQKKPAGCSHPDVPPSTVAGLAAGETVICKACGEAIGNPEAKPLGKAPADTPAAKGKGQTRLQE